jgi:LPS-assembly lipoprotein
MCLPLSSPRIAINFLAAISISLLVAGCGFQLRGQADLPFERIYVETQGFSLFGAELMRVIQSGDAVEVVDSPEEAQVVLKVLNERREKKILSLRSSGAVSEFLLVYRVSYRVTDNQNKDLVAPNEISLRRAMTYDDQVILGKESEQELLFRDMQADAVQQMLRRLSVVLVSS